MMPEQEPPRVVSASREIAAEPGQHPPGHLWRWELEPASPSRTRVTCTYDWTASLDLLAGLAEGS
jgi:hypothetical protein